MLNETTKSFVKMPLDDVQLKETVKAASESPTADPAVAQYSRGQISSIMGDGSTTQSVREIRGE